MEGWRFNRDWIRDKWIKYTKQQRKNDDVVDVVEFTNGCIQKVKYYINCIEEKR